LRKRQLCEKYRPVTGCYISDKTIIHSVHANNACIAQWHVVIFGDRTIIQSVQANGARIVQ